MITEKILVVDDNDDHRNAIEYLLKRQNYSVITASDGAGALKTLEKHNDMRVLIVDLAMKEVSGVDVLEKIKNRRDPIRRIVLTAYDEELTFERAEELKVFSYLTKPISKHSLLFAVKSAFKDLDIERLGKKSKGTKYQWDVFISYSSSDKPLVGKITTDLKSNGITYWLDYEQIEPGDKMIQSIEKGLKGSRFVLCCFSRNQLKSGWCRAEYESILDDVINGTTHQIVIPLILDNLKYKKVPPLIRRLKFERYSDPIGYQNILNRLKKP